jgi:hypothetical protein
VLCWAAAGFRIGRESVTAAPGIDGGSHLYAEMLAELKRIFALSLKYSLGLFPAYSENHLISVLPRVNIPLAPIHSGNIGGISTELMSIAFWLPYE